MPASPPQWGGSQHCSLPCLVPRGRASASWSRERTGLPIHCQMLEPSFAFCFAVVLEWWWRKTGKGVIRLRFLEGLGMRVLQLLAARGSPVFIYFSCLHLKRRNLKACHGAKKCNLSYRNILQTLERVGCFSQALLACVSPRWVWRATVSILGLSGKQDFSPDCGEVGMGKSVVMLLGRTCFSEQLGYNHVCLGKAFVSPCTGFCDCDLKLNYLRRPYS